MISCVSRKDAKVMPIFWGEKKVEVFFKAMFSREHTEVIKQCFLVKKRKLRRLAMFLEKMLRPFNCFLRGGVEVIFRCFLKKKKQQLM